MTTLTTLLRLADDTTRQIVIERDGEEWNALTIDGIPAQHWLDANGLQCGKGETVNAQARRAYRWKRFVKGSNGTE